MMKKVFLFTFLSALAFSCNEDKKNTSENNSSSLIAAGGQSEEELKESLKDFNKEEEKRLADEKSNITTLEFDKLIHDFGDQGGPRVNDQTRTLIRWRELLGEFSHRGVLIRNLETGQLDFPSLRGDHEIFLIWQEGDTQVDAWREIPPMT